MKRRTTTLNAKKRSVRWYTKMKNIVMGEQLYRKIFGTEIREDKGRCDMNSRKIKKSGYANFFCRPEVVKFCNEIHSINEHSIEKNHFHEFVKILRFSPFFSNFGQFFANS